MAGDLINDVGLYEKDLADLKSRLRVIAKSSPSGFFQLYKVTTMQVSTTPVALPAIADSLRQSISIENLDDTETLYIGSSNTVTADRVIGTTSGWEVGPEETANENIASGKVLWGVVASGTILVKILERG